MLVLVGVCQVGKIDDESTHHRNLGTGTLSKSREML